jgi:hypothetical protein
MSDIEPTYYNVGDMQGTGMGMGDLHRAVYNLWKALAALCNNLDEDSATLGTDFMSKIGTDLNTAMAKFKTPVGGDVT